MPSGNVARFPLWRRCQNVCFGVWLKKKKKVTASAQLRINYAHGVLGIFSSCCVKGGLGLCDSRRGPPWRREGLIDIHRASICGCGRSQGCVWRDRREGRRVQIQTRTRTCRVPEQEFGIPGKVGKSQRGVEFHLYSCRCSPVISRTVRNTLSFSGSRGSMLW